MPPDPDYVEAVHDLHSTDPILELYEVPIDGTTALRLVRNTRNVTWPSTGGDVWYAANIRRGAFELTTEEQTQRGSLTIKDPARRLAQVWLDNDGFLGKLLNVHFVLASRLDKTAPIRTLKYRIRTAPIEEEAGYKIGLGDYRVRDREEPHRTYETDHCPFFPFGGPECGFNTTLPGAPQTCSHRRHGPNGCESKGKWQRDNDHKVLHPARFGGIPTIPETRQ